MGKDSLFINGGGTIGQICAKKVKLEYLLMPYKRINSKGIKDLNRLKPIKILEENIGSKISDISNRNTFLIYRLMQGKPKIYINK